MPRDPVETRGSRPSFDRRDGGSRTRNAPGYEPVPGTVRIAAMPFTLARRSDAGEQRFLGFRYVSEGDAGCGIRGHSSAANDRSSATTNAWSSACGSPETPTVPTTPTPAIVIGKTPPWAA
jgi:hypothetical protein